MSESILAFLLMASSICTFLTAAVGVFVSIRNSRRIETNTRETRITHELVNGRMDEFKALIEKAAHAAGVKEESEKQDAKK